MGRRYLLQNRCGMSQFLSAHTARSPCTFGCASPMKAVPKHVPPQLSSCTRATYLRACCCCTADNRLVTTPSLCLSSCAIKGYRCGYLSIICKYEMLNLSHSLNSLLLHSPDLGH
uniref:Uncharacterized protein n=1 Tax=Parascaris univalens TaxID=6257 RepID=A0A915C328_PARUN